MDKLSKDLLPCIFETLCEYKMDESGQQLERLDHKSIKDILNVRLVCTSFKSAAIGPFTEVISSVHYTINVDDLDALQRITNNTSLAPRITTIRLSTRYPRAEPMEALEVMNTMDVMTRVGSSSRYPPPDVLKELTAQYGRELMQAASLRETGEDVTRLSRVLRALPNLEAIYLEHNEGGCIFRRYGYPDLEQFVENRLWADNQILDRPRPIVYPHEWAYVSAVLHKAIERLDARIKLLCLPELTVNYQHPDHPFNIAAARSPSFEYLTTLDVAYSDRLWEGANTGMIPPDIANYLLAFSRLETLRLSFSLPTADIGEIFRSMLSLVTTGAAPFPKLTELTLQFSPTTLGGETLMLRHTISFINAHAATLKELQLRPPIVDLVAWTQFLQDLSYLKLSVLYLEHAYVLRDLRVHDLRVWEMDFAPDADRVYLRFFRWNLVNEEYEYELWSARCPRNREIIRPRVLRTAFL